MFKPQAQLGKAELSNGMPVVAVTIGRDELEPSTVREILSCTCVDCLGPCGLEGKLCGAAEVGIVPHVDGLDAVPALDFLVAVEFDRLQLWVNMQAANA